MFPSEIILFFMGGIFCGEIQRKKRYPKNIQDRKKGRRTYLFVSLSSYSISAIESLH